MRYNNYLFRILMLLTFFFYIISNTNRNSEIQKFKCQSFSTSMRQMCPTDHGLYHFTHTFKCSEKILRKTKLIFRKTTKLFNYWLMNAYFIQNKLSVIYIVRNFFVSSPLWSMHLWLRLTCTRNYKLLLPLCKQWNN